LIGWSSEDIPPDITLADETYRSVDTVMHIVELSTTVEEPASSELVKIDSDQFTWLIVDRENAEGGFNDITLINPSWLTTRLMPVDGAKLREVETITIVLDRFSSSYGRDVLVSLWNWEAEEWFDLINTTRETYEIDNPERFVSPTGALELRIVLERDITGAPATGRIRDIRVVLTGYF
jgi:hypothetical protein